MTEIAQPVLPDCLVPDWEENEALQKRHAELQQSSVEMYQTYMPPVRCSTEGLYFVDTIDNLQDSIEDERHAVVVPIPFATGWRPHTAAKIDLLNAALGGGQRIIALPNSTQQTRATEYTRDERSMMAAGTLSPLEDRVLRLLDAHRIERVSIAGYSQGAALGVHLARAVAEQGVQQLEAAALSDMPTVVERNLGRLCADFVRTGPKSYMQAMDAAGIPLLRESVTPAGTAASAADFCSYVSTVALPENQALARSMRFATFGSTLMRAALHSDARFGLMRAEQSTVTPAAEYQQIAKMAVEHFAGRVTSLEIPGYGHEFGDHSVALALVEARALGKS